MNHKLIKTRRRKAPAAVSGHTTFSLGGTADTVNEIVVLPSGKILLSCYTDTGDRLQFAVARLNSNGTPDLSFGSGGMALTDFGAAKSAYTYVIAVQTDGKIVQCGYVYDNPTHVNVMALARYNTDGSLDLIFGAGGQVTTDFSHDNDYFYDVVVQSSGKILACGGTQVGGGYRAAEVRYNADGTLDTSFGTGGLIALDPSFTCGSMCVQADGKIIAVGTSGGDDPDTWQGGVQRWNTDGTLDATFGIVGTVSRPPLKDFFQKGALQGTKIVGVRTYNFAVDRLNSDGTSDASFGTDGTSDQTTFGGTQNFSTSVAVKGTEIAVVGSTFGPATGWNIGVVKIGNVGHVTASWTIDLGGTEYGTAVAYQPDGKLLVAGTSDSSGSQRIVVFRYNTDGTVDTSFGV